MAEPEHKRAWGGFEHPSDYLSSLKKTPKLFASRAFRIRSFEEQMADKEAAKGDMKKVWKPCNSWTSRRADLRPKCRWDI